ncbi:RNA polymerase sigma factor [Sandaracinobacteroides saxicola]|uniref:RNA polymerase sigma factor n=1 Tax=Sandaracinobacteroides saxicola TaxID=2759707 RepID=UPI0037DA3722
MLAARSGDLATAEDMLADALVAALERWPQDGVPANPQAWLLTVARRRAIDRSRRRMRHDAAQAELMRMHEEAEAMMNADLLFPDERLGLMLACAHPAIEEAARTPLMLQVVLGLTAERMAPVFLTSPAAMTKRLVRAKVKLAASGIGFAVPGHEDLAPRLAHLLDAIYAAFTLARDASRQADLEGEALWLGQLVVYLVPEEPEALGLYALMLFVSARPSMATQGHYVPLGEQDLTTWNEAATIRAEQWLHTAGAMAQPGRFQLEAAIQAVHANRRRSGRTDWDTILHLYDSLLALAPTVGARVARAAALTQTGDHAAALAALDAIEDQRIAAHQPYWATRAHVLAALEEASEAADAYQRAAGLASQPEVRSWLLARRAALAN